MTSLQNQWFAMGSNSPSYELQGNTYAELTVNGNSVKSVELIPNNFITLNSSTSVVASENKTGSYITIINPVVGHKVYAKITTSNPNLRVCWYKSGTTAYDFVTGEFLDSSSTVSNVFEGVYTVTQDMVYSDGYMQFYYWIYNGLATGNHTLTVQLIDLTELGMDSIINPVLFNATELGKLMSKRLVEFGSKIYSNGEYKVNQLVSFADTTITYKGLTITTYVNGKLKINGTYNDNVPYVQFNIWLSNSLTLIPNHKYFFKGSSNEIYMSVSAPYQEPHINTIFSVTSFDYIFLRIKTYNGKVFNNQEEGFNIVDLTDLYGAGNEPTTVEQFLTDYPMYNNYVEYAPIGTVRNGICLSDGNILPLSEPLRSVGDLKDSYSTSGKKIRKFAEVDLGSLNWEYQEAAIRFVSYNLQSKIAYIDAIDKIANIITTKYKTNSLSQIGVTGVGIAGYLNYIYIKDSRYTDATTFKTAMQGVKLIYELATPTETTTERLVLPTDTTILNAEYNKELRSVEFPIYTKKSELPYEYQEVEYLESTGTQYIDTGVIRQLDEDIEIEFSDYLNGALIGEKISQDPQTVMLKIDNVVYIKNFSSGSAISAIINELKHIVTLKTDGSVYLDGVKLARSTVVGINNSNLLIFCRVNPSGVAKIYKLKIGNRRFFIPCYRKADNVAGMYDLVNGVFYTNQGTGSFIVGNDVNTDIEIAPKQRTKNLFDISKVITTPNQLVNNGNGTLTVKAGNYFGTGLGNNKLKDFCPELKVGDIAILNFISEGQPFIYLLGSSSVEWRKNNLMTITQSKLDSTVVFYNMGGDFSNDIIISNIQIELGSTATAYEPYYDYLTELKRVGDIKDTYTTLNGIDMNRLGVVDLGELNYTYEKDSITGGSIFYAPVSNIKPNIPKNANILCAKYTKNNGGYVGGMPNNAISTHSSLANIYIRDDNYTNTTTFKQSLQGVKLIYELAEPTKTKYSSIRLPHNITKFVDKNGVEVEYIRKK